MKNSVKIIGIREEKYVGTTVTGHNCDFDYIPETKTRHVILGQVLALDHRKVEITLEKEEGESPSSWCTASWGRKTVKFVKSFSGYSYKPKEEIICNIYLENDTDDNNEIFEVSYFGSDECYPTGYYHINLDLFEPIESRLHDYRYTYIFKGASSIGKTYLASRLSSLVVYETDSKDYLPKTIVADVIVLGNRSGFSVEDVKSRIEKGSKAVIVDMVVSDD